MTPQQLRAEIVSGHPQPLLQKLDPRHQDVETLDTEPCLIRGGCVVDGARPCKAVCWARVSCA